MPGMTLSFPREASFVFPLLVRGPLFFSIRYSIFFPPRVIAQRFLILDLLLELGIGVAFLPFIRSYQGRFNPPLVSLCDAETEKRSRLSGFFFARPSFLLVALNSQNSFSLRTPCLSPLLVVGFFSLSPFTLISLSAADRLFFIYQRPSWLCFLPPWSEGAAQASPAFGNPPPSFLDRLTCPPCLVVLPTSPFSIPCLLRH